MASRQRRHRVASPDGAAGRIATQVPGSAAGGEARRFSSEELAEAAHRYRCFTATMVCSMKV